MYSLDSTAVVASLLSLAGRAAADSVSVTPHASYSSSVGVLGCKIDTNRVAYWPGSVDCTNICVKLTYGGRSVNLLRIDESAGAHDISYDAWVYLQTGNSATTDPLVGGGIAMEYEDVDASACADLIHTSDSKLPLSGSNSMNFVSSCISDSSSWVGQNHVLYNILDPICSYGYDEECTLDLDVSNQPSCPHTLGLTTSLTTAPVYNIEYETGIAVNAATGETVSVSVALAADSTDNDSTADSSNGSGSSDSSDSSDSSSTSTSATSTAAAADTVVAVVAKPSSTLSTASTATAVTSSAVTSSSSTYIAPETTVAAAVTTAVNTTTAAETTTTAQLSSNSPGIFIATSETVNTPSAVFTHSSRSSSFNVAPSSFNVAPSSFNIAPSSFNVAPSSFNAAPSSSSVTTTVATTATTTATAAAISSVTTAGGMSTTSGSARSINAAPSSSSVATTVATTATTTATAAAISSVTTAGGMSTTSGSARSIYTKSSATTGTAPSSGKTAGTTFSVAKVSATKAASTSDTANATGASSSSTTTVTSGASNGAAVHLWVAFCASLACFALALLG